MRRRHTGSVKITFKKNYRRSTEFFVTEAKIGYRKTKDGVIPVFNDLTSDMQEFLRAGIATTEGVSSSSLEATMPLNARQIGQLKRRLKSSQRFTVQLP